ncbi:MAG TPA: hypothetical protein VGM39_05545 [Kofleriaceae bacterium]
MKKRWLIWVGIGVGYAALCFALYWRLFLRKQMAGWDSIEEYWPDLIYQSQLISHGELPLWNPYTVGGYAFFADPQASMLAPINLVCVAASAIGGTGPWLMELKLILLFYSALWGMHLLVYRRTKCHAAGFIAAITFVIGSPNLVHKNGALLWPLLYLPWALLAFDAFLARPSLRRGALLGIALGAMGAAGHPQGFEYCVFILFAYGLYRVVGALVKREYSIVQHVRALAPGLLLAAVIGAIWVWCTYGPASSIVEGSDRAQRTMDWVLANPLDVKTLRELFAPDLDTNWTFDVYMGPLAVVLTAWFAAVKWEGRFWIAVAIGGLVLALGAHAGLLPVLAKHVPGFALFRIPYRYKLITGFACAVGAGLGVGHLMMGEVTRAQKILLAVLCVAWVSVAAMFKESPSLDIAIGVLALVVLIAVDAVRRRKYAAALVVLAAVELSYAGNKKLEILQPMPSADQGVAQLVKLPGVDRDWRFWVGGRYSSSPGDVPFAAAYRVHARELSGFEQPLTPSRAIALNAFAAQRPAVLPHFNVKYVAGPRGTFTTVADVAPLVRVYPQAWGVPQAQQLAYFAGTAPKDVSGAIIEPNEPTPALPRSEFAPVDGKVISYGRNTLTLEVTAPAAGVAVVNEVFAPGWHATVDGAPVALFRANYMLRGLVVPAGTHRIEMELRAPAYEAALLALALLLGITALLSLMRPHGWDRVNVYMYPSRDE